MGSRLDIPPVCANLLKYQLSGCMGVQTLQSGQLLSGLVDQETDHAAVVRAAMQQARGSIPRRSQPVYGLWASGDTAWCLLYSEAHAQLTSSMHTTNCCKQPRPRMTRICLCSQGHSALVEAY